MCVLKYGDVDFKWISSHYDIHLNGTCTYNNKMCLFESGEITYNEDCDDFDVVYVNIYRLSLKDKIKWKFKQFMFEQCVGYHWTYPYRKQGAGFYYRNPKWLYIWLFNKYFQLKK